MLARLALLVLSLWVAATASANPLIGVWRSDPDLTLLEMKESATLTLEQREVLSIPDLFDQLLAIRDDREIELRLAEGSTRLSYRVLATGSDSVDEEYDDEGPPGPVRMQPLLHGGPLHVPVEVPGFHEVFRHVDAPAALTP
jgi:hypothetical protein